MMVSILGRPVCIHPRVIWVHGMAGKVDCHTTVIEYGAKALKVVSKWSKIEQPGCTDTSQTIKQQ
jgi:hypothetical protein